MTTAQLPETVTPKREGEVVDAAPKELFIGGAWRPGAHGTYTVEDPSTQTALCEVADGSPDDALDALAAASEAQADWAASAPRERSEILRRAFEAIHEQREQLALLMTLEMGKPLAESRGEVQYGAEFFRWFAEEAVRVSGTWSVAPDGNGRVLTMRQPVGPCLFITPWNFPLAMGTRKIGPALAAGCTMVVKPAAQTPLTMLALVRILEQAGVPAGVVNLVTTSTSRAAMTPLMEDRRLRKVSFTGSTEVGAGLLAQAAANVIRTSMELGGNAPFLVLADADVDAAVQGALLAKMRNGGEACTAANRFYVVESLVDEFTEGLSAAMGRLRLGRGSERGTDVGPLIDDDQRGKVSELVADALDRGADAVVGDGPVPDAGYFYAPTVLAGVRPESRVLAEEIFGPVAPVVTVADADEAIAAANDTEYGLVAYVYTRDITRAIRTVEALETGMVGLNRGLVSNASAPFGGVKLSGLGREGGPTGIDEYLELKYVALDG